MAERANKLTGYAAKKAERKAIKKQQEDETRKAYERLEKLQQTAAGVDYLAVLDFEATCVEKGRLQPQEIIEFPTLLVDVETGEVEDVFHFYVKPDVHPKLSVFCTELTGIRQKTIDGIGIPLSEALDQHQQWLKTHNIIPWHLASEESHKAGKSTFLYLTCGDWDLSTCLPKQLQYHKASVPQQFNVWINIKYAFREKYGKKPGGMKRMLYDLGLELEGRHHSGIDDCKNIARICKVMLREGWNPVFTSCSY